MSLKLAQVDYIAVSQRSFLHMWPTMPKLSGSMIFLVGIIAASNLRQGAVLLCLLIGLLLSARLPVWLFRLALYPAFFSIPFALAQLSTSCAAAIAVLCKAVSAALLLALLVATTPYPQLFGVMARALPPLITDALFFAYRLFFITLGSIQRLLLSLRQRGAFGRRNFVWSCRAALHALGYLMVNTLSISQRLDQNYRLRGYGAKGCLTTEKVAWRAIDGVVLVTLAVLVGGVLWLG